MKAGIAVCDSTCLIALSRINRLDILTEAFERITIPDEVRLETHRYALQGIEVRSVSNPERILSFPLRVDRGEAAVIALAMEIQGAEAILDDFKGRQLAVLLGLRVVGTIGLILRAKFEGRLESIRPLLDALNSDGFRMSDQLYLDALRLSGER